MITNNYNLFFIFNFLQTKNTNTSHTVLETKIDRQA